VKATVLALLAAGLLVGSALAQPATPPTLYGATGPGYQISLRNAKGRLVAHLTPGTYRIVVNDRAADHNFHLAGPGVQKWTTIDATGKFTWTVKLRAGHYLYQCDLHTDVMRESFRVS
jgi:hypothetical protein